MKKMVVMMNVYDEKSKKRIIQTVAGCSGIASINMDSQDGKLTVIGELNMMKILSKLQRKWKNTKLATFGPYDPKKEAEKQREEALHRSYRENYVHPYNFIYDHDHYHGCVIS